MDITLAARTLFAIGPFQITDAILGSFLVSVFIVAIGIWWARSFHLVPTRSQALLEVIAEYLLSQLRIAFGSEREARKFFGLVFTLLIFIGVANQFTIMPLLFEITYGGSDLVRQPTSDLTGTIALAIMVVGLSHVLALRLSPLAHLRTFLPLDKFLSVRSVGDFFNAGIELFIGLLNIVGEFAKVVSLAARLFGNIFAGNVMAAVIASLIPFVAPIPFVALSIFSGFVQAFVFMLLSMQFIAGTVEAVRPRVQEAQREASA